MPRSIQPLASPASVPHSQPWGRSSPAPAAARDPDFAPTEFPPERAFLLEIEYEAIRAVASETGGTWVEHTAFRLQGAAGYGKLGSAPVAGAGGSARRIAESAVGRFRGAADPASSEGRAERIAFIDRVVPAVDRGTRAPLQANRTLPDQIAALANIVFELVGKIFDFFVEHGTLPPPKPEPSGEADVLPSAPAEEIPPGTPEAPFDPESGIDVTA